MAEPKLDIKIQAHVEVGEMRKMEESLQREIVQLRLAGNEADKLAAKEANLGDLRKKIAAVPLPRRSMAALSEAAQSIPGVGPIFSAFNGSTLGLAAGIGLVAKGFSLAGASIRAFAASEVEMAKLDAALANSGKLTDDYRERLSQLATERSQATGIDDEKYIGVFTALTKFGADSGNIGKYTEAVENLAGFMGGDIAQAAFLFGKAMQGSTEMLGRYGITVDKSKSQTEQLADIMRQLAARGGGQLEAMGNTLQGSFNKAANAWENLLEAMGGAAEKSGLNAMISNWATGLEAIAGFLGADAPSKSKNREVLIGDTPEAQKEADRIASSRRILESGKALLQEERDLPGLAGETLEEQQKRIGELDRKIRKLDAQLARMAGQEKKLGLRRVTPEEAALAHETEGDLIARVAPKQAEVDAASRKASDEYEALQASNAEKREVLGLEVEMAEAVATGNKEAQARLKWQADYARLLKEAKAAGAGEDAYNLAIRGANALAVEKDKKPDGVDLSSLAARGGSVGESLAAAAADARRRTQEAATAATVALTAATKNLNETLKEPLKVTTTYGF